MIAAFRLLNACCGQGNAGSNEQGYGHSSTYKWDRSILTPCTALSFSSLSEEVEVELRLTSHEGDELAANETCPLFSLFCGCQKNTSYWPTAAASENYVQRWRRNGNKEVIRGE